MWYQNERDTMDANTEKLKKNREGIKKHVRLLLGFKVILLQCLKVIEVPHSSGHTIKATDKEKGKKAITLNIKYSQRKEKKK